MLYQVGLITATALGGFLYSVNNPLPFLLYGCALLVGAVITFFYIEPSIDSEKFSVRNYFLQIKNGSREVFNNSYIAVLSLYYVCIGGIAWSSTVYFNDYMLLDLGFGDGARGYISATVRIINAFIVAKILINKKIFNQKRTISFFPIVMLLAYLPGFVLDGYWGIPFVQMAMILTTARFSLLSPLVNEKFSSKYRATAISFLSLLIGVVFIFITSISGFIISKYGVGTMFSFLGIVSLFTVVPLAIRLNGLSKRLVI